MGAWVIEGQDGLITGGASSLDGRRTAILRRFTGLSMCLIVVDGGQVFDGKVNNLYLARNAIKICPPLTLRSRGAARLIKLHEYIPAVGRQHSALFVSCVPPMFDSELLSLGFQVDGKSLRRKLSSVKLVVSL